MAVIGPHAARFPQAAGARARTRQRARGLARTRPPAGLSRASCRKATAASSTDCIWACSQVGSGSADPARFSRFPGSVIAAPNPTYAAPPIWWSAGRRGRRARQDLEQHLRRGLGRVGGGVVLRGHLDDVAADDVEPGAAAHQLHGLARAQAAGFRRAGAGREGGIEAVDVEGDVGRARRRRPRGSS